MGKLWTEKKRKEMDGMWIRAKWTYDGAKTLKEIKDKLKEQESWIDELIQNGFELAEPMCDDYGSVEIVYKKLACIICKKPQKVEAIVMDFICGSCNDRIDKKVKAFKRKEKKNGKKIHY